MDARRSLSGLESIIIPILGCVLLGFAGITLADLPDERGAVIDAGGITTVAAPAWVQKEVKIAYIKLESYIRGSDQDIDFSISEFQTIERHAFGESLVSGILTPARTRPLEVLRTKVKEPSGRQSVFYQLITHDDVPLLPVKEPEMTFSAFLFDDLAQEDPTLHDTLALTRYRVVVTLDGIPFLDYYAAVLWLLEEAGGQRLVPLDRILPEVSWAMAEPLTPYRSASRPEASAPTKTASDSSGCQPRTLEFMVEMPRQRDFRHHTGDGGFHYLEVDAVYTCSCDPECVNRCEPNIWQIPGCGEWGQLDSDQVSGRYHVPQSEVSVSGRSVQEGDENTVSCTAGAGCAIGVCDDPNCLFNISLSVSADVGGVGAEAQVSTVHPTAWKRGWAHTYECPKCIPASSGDPDGSNPGDPGGGGGGGSAGCNGEQFDGHTCDSYDTGGFLWYTDCDSDGTIDYLTESGMDALSWGLANC